jgi:nicotinamide phosphoribosyltransferase
MKRYLLGCAVTEKDVEEAEDYVSAHLGTDIFNKEGWLYIAKDLKGRLPIEIKAVPEGTVVNNKNVLFTMVNTDPKCFWLTNFLETLLVQVWCPTTVATNSREMRKIVQKYMLETCETIEGIQFKVHDFGCRGVSSMETAGIAGIAHLLSFEGTDTVPALVVGREYYGSDCAGYSIPASEHSTMTSHKTETDAMRNMLEQFESSPTVACVSDSYDIFNACDSIWGSELKDKVMQRNGTLVIRPDSGDPMEVLPMMFQILGAKFGYTVNSKGYKVLDSHVRVIQGDGIDIESMENILEKLKSLKWSADNIAFGSGGGLLQRHHRDTLKCAFKCSYIEINGIGRKVYKNPITDPGKKSFKGLVTLQKDNNGKYETMEECEKESICFMSDQMIPVFLNGELLIEYELESIRDRAKLF